MLCSLVHFAIVRASEALGLKKEFWGINRNKLIYDKNRVGVTPMD